LEIIADPAAAVAPAQTLVLLVGRHEVKPHEDPIRAKRVDALEAKISE